MLIVVLVANLLIRCIYNVLFYAINEEIAHADKHDDVYW